VIDEAGVRDLVEVTGPLPPTEVADLLARAHVLVIPSIWADPFPLVCIEGALARVPIVASNVGGIPECLTDKEHALLVAPGDSVECADAIWTTLTESEETQKRVVRALERAQEFGWERYLDESERFVDEAYAALTESPRQH
jgi:glycosyltransferase involved in cell wall biosynthesis